MEGYVFAVMGLRFLVDLFLLAGVNRLHGAAGGGSRCVIAACVGGLYTGFCLLPNFRWLGSLYCRLACLLLSGTIAYGVDRGGFRKTSLFLVMSMALGGIALEFGRGRAAPLLVSSMILWLLCRVGFDSDTGPGQYVPVTIFHGGRQTSILALRDTGNTLRDPVSGEPVLVVSASVAENLTGLTADQLKKPLETILAKKVSGLRLIPYQAVGCSGMLLARAFSDVKIGKIRRRAIVAFAPEGLDGRQVYQGLTGGAL